jgi:hypothetical protein
MNLPFKLTLSNLLLIFQNLIDLWDITAQIRDRLKYHGAYEILSSETTLEILDEKGEYAALCRKQLIRCLQDNVVTLHDYVWGDGHPLFEYQTKPGVKVDEYEDGSRIVVLISLRESKNRGDVIDQETRRLIKGGFLGQEEWLETQVDHPVKRLCLSLLLPAQRRASEAALKIRSTNRLIELSTDAYLEDGKQKITCEIRSPKLYECYTLRWKW